MRVVVLQSNYFPWRGYFQLIKGCDLFVFYDEVKYTKNDWRNRNQIASASGKHWITIPISSESVKKKISEVTLDYADGWRSSHQSLLQFCYGKSPYYNSQIKGVVFDLINSETNSLSELNISIIQELSKQMGLQTKFLNSNELRLPEGRIERLVSTLRQVGATEYISGPAAKDYLKDSLELFEEEKIKLTFHEYKNIREYTTTHNSYSADLSVLDLLANVDINEAANYF